MENSNFAYIKINGAEIPYQMPTTQESLQNIVDQVMNIILSKKLSESDKTI